MVKAAFLARHHLLIICFCISLLAAILLPIGSRFQIGGDEGFELIKAFMCRNGFALYSDIWNDQPPLHTLLLTVIFKLFGVSLLAGRLLAIGFGTLFVFLFTDMLRRDLGAWPALAGMAILLTAPMVLDLGVSVMLEMPAFSLGMLSFWLVSLYRRRPSASVFLFSTIAMAVALQIKLTSAILIPTIVASLVLSRGSFQNADNRFISRYNTNVALTDRLPCGNSIQVRRLIILSGLWVSIVALAFCLLGVLLGNGGYDLLWASHSAKMMNQGVEGPMQYAFSINQLGEFPEGTLGSILGLTLITCRKKLRRYGPPIIFLATVFVIHEYHRPWWPYYYLHLSISLVWISACAFHEIRVRYRALTSYKGGTSEVWKRILRIAIILPVALWICYGGERFTHTIVNICAGERIRDNILLNRIMELAPQAKYFYTRSPIYAFHARLCIPPELAVLPAKRFWSGRITNQQVLDIVKKYQPDLLLLDPEEITGEWNTYLLEKYCLVAENDHYQLWIGNRINPNKPIS